jgi:hypothetical protein
VRYGGAAPLLRAAPRPASPSPAEGGRRLDADPGTRAAGDRRRRRRRGRAAPAGAAPPPPAAGAARRRPDIVRLANLPHECDLSEAEYESLVVLVLDRQLGDYRNIQNIQRYLSAMMTNSEFPAQLDMAHEHLLPFANGVLDLDAMDFRAGRPDDLVMRGPAYPFVHYDAEEPLLLEMERMLCALFTDRELVDWFLRFGGTLLRRRNRFKHFCRGARTRWVRRASRPPHLHWGDERRQEPAAQHRRARRRRRWLRVFEG